MSNRSPVLRGARLQEEKQMRSNLYATKLSAIKRSYRHYGRPIAHDKQSYAHGGYQVVSISSFIGKKETYLETSFSESYTKQYIAFEHFEYLPSARGWPGMYTVLLKIPVSYSAHNEPTTYLVDSMMTIRKDHRPVEKVTHDVPILCEPNVDQLYGLGEKSYLGKEK